VTRNVLQAVIGTVLLLAPAAAFAQADASSSTGTTSSVQTVRPVATVAPRIGVQVRTPPAATAQADLERQVREIILRQGRSQMNALVPGSGLALSPDRFDDVLEPPPPAIAPPVRHQSANGENATAPRRTTSGTRAPRFRLGERVSEPLPLRKGGRYDW
jgi:hypothetical protein